MDEAMKKQVQEMIDKALANALGFTARKYGDTPTDPYQLTPLSYVTANGSIASRPVSSIQTTGQFFFFTQTGTYSPAWKAPNGAWVNGVGSVIVAG